MAQTTTTARTLVDLHDHPVPRDQFARQDRRPRRSPSLMRNYEAAALLSDQSIAHVSVLAPASPVFEACASAFARGTLISTVMGPVAIEDLQPGDLVETARGPEPVMWIGSTSYVPRVAAEGTGLTRLYRITADGMGYGDPKTDTLLGPAARLVIRQDRFADLLNCDAVLAPTSDYVDGDRVLEVTPPGAVALYHLALPRHGIIRANGVEFESYHPGRSALQELDGAEKARLLGLFPHLDSLDGFGALIYPRTTRQVIDSLRVM